MLTYISFYNSEANRLWHNLPPAGRLEECHEFARQLGFSHIATVARRCSSEEEALHIDALIEQYVREVNETNDKARFLDSLKQLGLQRV